MYVYICMGMCMCVYVHMCVHLSIDNRVMYIYFSMCIFLHSMYVCQYVCVCVCMSVYVCV